MENEVSGWLHAPSAQGTAIQPAPAPAAPRPPSPGPLRAAKVALLLPLSGAQSELGKNLADGAQLAVIELGREKFELMPRDSGTSPQQAALATQEALSAGAQLIIGPLFSASVNAVREQAARSQVPVLALSNDSLVAGGGAWVLGFSPAEQVRRISDFAAARGWHRLGVLAPNSAYGELVIATLKTGLPVEITALGRYQNAAAAQAVAVENLARQRVKFDALFIPEGGANLRRIASLLAVQGLSSKQVPYLGTGLWDEAETLSDPNVAGGWYAAPDPSARADFVHRYEKNFGRKPARLASLAYDATALAEALANKGVGDPFNPGALTNPNGFAGLDGIFRLTPEGTAERGLAVMMISNGAAQVIEAAPKRF